MVVTSNDITQRNYKKLSIQVSLSGLSFCVFDTITNKILVHNSVAFKKNEVIDSQLWNAFMNNTTLSKSYDEIIVQKLKHGQKIQIDMIDFESGFCKDKERRLTLTSIDKLMLREPDSKLFGIGSATIQNNGLVQLSMKRGL